MADWTKYLEKNYSDSNAFQAIKEYAEDLMQAQEAGKTEALLEDYMKSLKSKKQEHHYLVDGAVLTCTCCTLKTQKPMRRSFTALPESKEAVLKTTQNSTAKNGEGQCFATIKDSRIYDNIKPFGNCINPPDRDKEKKAILLAEESEELLKLGTCRYMMELNEEWENILSSKGYEEVTGLGGELQKTITMESVLFCRHGGFIYPINSGYIEGPEAYETWSELVNEVGQWYLNNVSTYCYMTSGEIKAAGGPSTDRGRKGYGCDLEGNLNGFNVYDDCSGFVWACLVQGGYFDSSTEVFQSTLYRPDESAAPHMKEAGFEWYSGAEMKGEELQIGDILVKKGHIEIFKEFDNDGVMWAWTWGNVYKEEPKDRSDRKDNVFPNYEGVWRLGDE